ncbi:alpha 1,2 mannosyltransferase [Elasticomyces elasticus]|nr:alpha 1,2 mannosyltransferase [Elasticomyces elasticus]KAK5001260.1 alpha 1,2 mannosyltransferase [Elasticomyces elasticus]
MWRSCYLLLVLVRLYLALSPSYLHPDENFQGPEVIAGRVFSYPIHKTWDFAADDPIRSLFPLWLFYGCPLTVLKWFWQAAGRGVVPPAVAFYTLRLLMFVLSLVLEDRALLELAASPARRRLAVLLVASSYVTWTYQTHTFSNSIETLIVLWSLVLVKRIREDSTRSGIMSSCALAFIGVLGLFNRITFPAFVVVPGLQLLPHFWRKPYSLLAMALVASATALVAIIVDTKFYAAEPVHLSSLYKMAVVTPLANLRYNLESSNLARHGLHPHYQHLAANLPQLLGPAFPLLFLSHKKTLQIYSAISGLIVLSCFKHQEARFLLPAVPLVLSSIRLPSRFTRLWLGAWILFNLSTGILMGIYHQGGVVPVQNWIFHRPGIDKIFWWKTYSPPFWLLGTRNADISTRDLMGMPGEELDETISWAMDCGFSSGNDTLLVAPLSVNFLDAYVGRFGASEEPGLVLEEVWRYRNHVGLDDLDFAEDGVWTTLRRVVGRRGLGVWRVRRRC